MADNTQSTQSNKSPPIGSPCWTEIPAVDVQACKKFYASLFPSWTFSSPTAPATDDTLAHWAFAAPSGLTGGILKVSAECKQAGGELKNGVGVTVYHFVDSIDGIKEKVEELGGKSCSGKEKAGEHGVYMLFKDVEGNRFGVYEHVGGEEQARR